MGFWGYVRCLFAPHVINRRRVRSDKETFSGYCRFCNAPLLRITRDRWVRDWRATFGMQPLPQEEKDRPPVAPARRRSRRRK